MVYIISDVKKSLGLEWIITILINKYSLKLILINCDNSSLEILAKKKRIPYIKINYKKKYIDFFPCLIRLIFILIKWKPKIVHCHLRKASLIGLIGSYILRIKKRIYTRHHGVESKNNKLEKILDKIVFYLATNIIAISEEIKLITISNHKFVSNKITKIHHGFNLNYVRDLKKNKVNSMIRKYKIKNNYYVIGVVSRLVDWKNVDKIIDAFFIYNNYYNPNSVLVLSNVKFETSYSKKILNKLKCLNKNSYRLIEFEEDIYSLYRCFDLFIHVPKLGGYEAFGQTYVEAMLSKVPTIFSKSGIAKEIGRDRVNTYFCNPEKIYSILKGMKYHSNLSKNSIRLVSSAYNLAIKKFSLDDHISSLNQLYR